jgi:hypothetical protein
VPGIVRIERGHELASRSLNREVSSRGDVVLMLSNEGDPRVACGKALDFRRGVVVGPIVHDDDLEVPVRLSRNRVERLVDRGCSVERRNDHRDEWLHDEARNSKIADGFRDRRPVADHMSVVVRAHGRDEKKQSHIDR